MKYTTVTISGIITQIAVHTEIMGYTSGVLEAFLPDENQLTESETADWIEANNKRMNAICRFLNDQNL